MRAEEVLPLYGEGVAAVDRWAGEVASLGRWGEPACGKWSAVDLAGHVLCVSRWYHGWLDRAEAGDSVPPAGFDLDAENDAWLAALPPGSGEERTAAFVASAGRYAERLTEAWDLPYGWPRGTVTAGEHAAMAALEWHVHAWDLARVVDGNHVPSAPGVLVAGVLECRAVAARRPVPRSSADPDPWGGLLRALGRL